MSKQVMLDRHGQYVEVCATSVHQEADSTTTALDTIVCCPSCMPYVINVLVSAQYLCVSMHSETPNGV